MSELTPKRKFVPRGARFLCAERNAPDCGGHRRGDADGACSASFWRHGIDRGKRRGQGVRRLGDRRCKGRSRLGAAALDRFESGGRRARYGDHGLARSPRAHAGARFRSRTHDRAGRRSRRTCRRRFPPPISLPIASARWWTVSRLLRISQQATLGARVTVRAPACRPRAGRWTEPRRPAQRSPESTERSAPADDSLAQEIALLRDARAALDAGDAARSLAILNQYAARISQGHPRARATGRRACSRSAPWAARMPLDGTRKARANRAPLPHLAQIHASCAGTPED